MKRQIKEVEFFDRLNKRLRKYAQAIPVRGDGTMIMHMLQKAGLLVSHIKNDNIKFKTLGPGVWGYGVNACCDGTEEYANTDVLKIEKIGELNKHVKYNLLWLIIFKIDGDMFKYHLYCMDTVKGVFNSNIDRSIPLQDLKSVSLRKRASSYILDLEFVSLAKPFSFELDSMYSPADMASDYKEVFEEILIKQKSTDTESEPKQKLEAANANYTPQITAQNVTIHNAPVTNNNTITDSVINTGEMSNSTISKSRTSIESNKKIKRWEILKKWWWSFVIPIVIGLFLLYCEKENWIDWFK